MSNTLELLEAQKEELEKERARLDADINDIDAAIKAIRSRRGGAPSKSSTAPRKTTPPKKTTKRSKTAGQKVSLDDAIVAAVGKAHTTPVMILDYVTDKLGVETTINSVRTRVSRLKREGLLARTKNGWSLPERKEKKSSS